MEIFLNKMHFIISSKQIDSLQMNLVRTAHTQGNGNSPLKIMFQPKWFQPLLVRFFSSELQFEFVTKREEEENKTAFSFMLNESRPCSLRKRELRAPGPRAFVGKGLTAGLASPPALVAGNSWWVLCWAAELSSPKKFLANPGPGQDKERWVSSGSRFQEPQWGEQCPAQQGHKGHPLPMNSSPKKPKGLKRSQAHSLLGMQ